jgi:hypothetical protein
MADDPVGAARSDPAIVLPDTVAQRVPDGLLGWADTYVSHGGHLLVDYDAGTYDQGGNVRPVDLFDPLLGINFSDDEGTSGVIETRSATEDGKVTFSSAAAASGFDVPPGKLTTGNVLSGYSFGPLVYPLANARLNASDVHDVDVVASSGSIPVIAERHVGDGVAIWSALPLGRLSSYDTDSMPLDSVLETVAVGLAGIPRLLLAPGGGGGLVIDWHVESSADWTAIPAMEQSGILVPGITQEFDISAGPDEKRAGDGLGFDACGKGRDALDLLLERGESIGTDAGGVQDLFATELEQGQLSQAQRSTLVANNATCLETATGEHMLDYVGPDGVFPQPQMTQIIQRLGLIGYYYTGDSGAPPQLAFWDGRPTSSSVWAFPVAPFGRLAALADMAKAGVPAAAVESWLNSVARYAASQGTIQLIYSHPPDLDAHGYSAAVAAFLGYVAQLQAHGQLVTEPMHVYAEFLNRRAQAHIAVRRNQVGLQLTVVDDAGLKDVAIGVPNSWQLRPAGEVSSHGVVGDERSYVVNANVHQVVLQLVPAIAGPKSTS